MLSVNIQTLLSEQSLGVLKQIVATNYYIGKARHFKHVAVKEDIGARRKRPLVPCFTRQFLCFTVRKVHRKIRYVLHVRKRLTAFRSNRILLAIHACESRYGCLATAKSQVILPPVPFTGGSERMMETARNFPSRHAFTVTASFHPPRETILPRSVKDVPRKAEDVKSPTCRISPHSLAAHLIEGGYDIRMVRELPGHNDVKTPMIHTHVLDRGLGGPAQSGGRCSRQGRKLIMPIRITHRDKPRDGVKPAKDNGLCASLATGSFACHAAGDPKICILCGSV